MERRDLDEMVGEIFGVKVRPPPTLPKHYWRGAI